MKNNQSSISRKIGDKGLLVAAITGIAKDNFSDTSAVTSKKARFLEKNLPQQRVVGRQMDNNVEKDLQEEKLTHEMTLLARVITEGFHQTMTISPDSDKRFLEQFETFKEDDIEAEISKLEQKMYSLHI